MQLLAVGVLVAALSVAGCTAPRGAYDWGAYEELLYKNYKDAANAAEMRTGLETHITAVEASNGRVAPGLYAELGTLYLEAGDSSRAIELYARERAAWPESKGLMDAMIATLERRAPAAPEAGQ